MSGAGMLTTREFAEAARVTPETVRRWVRRGRLVPAGRTPTGQLRFRAEQVGEALSARGAEERARGAEKGVVASMERIRMLRGRLGA